MIAPATPPNPQQKLWIEIIIIRIYAVAKLAHPRMAYARPSLLGSVTNVTEPRATPTAPAKMPCSNLTHIAC